MAYEDEIDHKEHAYWGRYCPACDASPCIGRECDSFDPAKATAEYLARIARDAKRR